MKDFPSLWYASVIEGDPLPVQWVVQTVVTWCETFFTSFKGVQFGASHRHKDSFLWCRNKVHCTQHNSLVKKENLHRFPAHTEGSQLPLGVEPVHPPFFVHSFSVCIPFQPALDVDAQVLCAPPSHQHPVPGQTGVVMPRLPSEVDHHLSGLIHIQKKRILPTPLHRIIQ